MTTPNATDDLPRDDHLRAALRHAPDAGRQAPAHLRAQIVAAAYRAVDEQPARAPRPRRWWMPGPMGASGALATVLLAGVLGLIWQGGPPGPALDGPEVAGTAAPAPMAPPASATADETRQAAQREAPAPRAAAPTIPVSSPRAVTAAPAGPALPNERARAARRQAEPAAAVAPPVAAEPPAVSPPAEMAVAESPVAAPSPPAAAPPVPSPPPGAGAQMPRSVPAPAPPRAPAPAPAPAATPALAPAATPVLPLANLDRQRMAERTEAARGDVGQLSNAAASAADAAATPPAPLRWRIDGADRGSAPRSWADTAAATDRRFGQASALGHLPAARRVDLLGPAGTVASLWLTDFQLLWCPADGSGCRLSTPDGGLPALLLRALPAVSDSEPAAEPAARQPPKRDSR